jgi:F-type H+-transporting ATPase subunit delta
MAEASTIARPYAEAAFKLASQQNALPDWASALDRLAVVSGTPEAQQIADDPALSIDKVTSVIADSAGSLSKEQNNLLHTLVENGRLGVMGEVAAHFRKLHNEQAGTLDAIVESAYPLDDAQEADIKQTLEAKYGRKISTEVHVVPELIGGVSIRIGDEVIDSSVRGKLEKMASSLKV